MRPDQRKQLIYCHPKRDCVHETKRPQNHEPRQTVLITATSQQLKELIVSHEQRGEELLQTDSLQNLDEPRIRAKRIPSRIDF